MSGDDGRQPRGGLDVATVQACCVVGAAVLGLVPLDEASTASGLAAEELRGRVRDTLREMDERAASSDVESSGVDVSVVLPVLNEEGGIESLIDRIEASLDPVGRYEIIVVDDGSTDDTLQIVSDRHDRDPRVIVASFSRNFGHQAALLAGLRLSSGRAVVMMDADGQDPPDLLPTLIDQWRSGFEVVYGVRRARKESWWKRASYAWFYRVLYRIAEVPMPVDAGDFCLMDRQVVDALVDLPESTRFLRGLRVWVGFRQTGVEYDRPAREQGVTKYSLAGLVRLALDGLLSFSSLPLRLASLLGFIISMAGVVYLGFALTARAFAGEVPAGWTSIVCIVLLLGGAQLTVIGVLGEYLARVYAETKRRPAYLIRSLRR